MTTTYALMGATGATGSSILRHLLANPPKDTTLNIYVRNKAKLLQAFPNLETQTPQLRIRIFEGGNTDVNLLRQCLSGAHVILMCIAVNVTKKGDNLFTSTAAAVVSALRQLRDEKQQPYVTPTLAILRAYPLNRTLSGDSLTLHERVLWYALGYVYGNMIEANEFYEAQARETPGLLECVYVDPPAIHDAEGTRATGYELVLEPREDVGHCVSYADLGVAFCEIVARRRDFVGKGVGVVGTGEIKLTWSSNVSAILLNIRARWLGW